MKANIGITAENTKKTASALNKLLATEYGLYTKTRKFHWNVEGMEFSSLHSLFEEQYNEIEQSIDEIAERIRKIGHYAIGSLKEFATLSEIEENDKTSIPAKDMVKELAEGHEVIVRLLRDLLPMTDESNDIGTDDLFTQLIATHETNAWKLRSTCG